MRIWLKCCHQRKDNKWLRRLKQMMKMMIVEQLEKDIRFIMRKQMMKSPTESYAIK
jgi:hypothetical protein